MAAGALPRCRKTESSALNPAKNAAMTGQQVEKVGHTAAAHELRPKSGRTVQRAASSALGAVKSTVSALPCKLSFPLCKGRLPYSAPRLHGW